MSLSSVCSPLIFALRSRHAVSLFRDAVIGDPELCSYPTFEHARDELRCTAPERYPMRESLMRFFIAQAQATREAVWASALLVAFMPMLSRLRSGLRGRVFDSGELDQIVLAAFLETIAAFPLDVHRDRTAMHLRQDTRRAVLRILVEAQRVRSEQVSLRRRSAGDRAFNPMSEVASGTEPNDADVRELERNLRKQLARNGDAEHADLVCATTLGGKSVASYVDELCPDVSQEERDRVYERLYRRRRRVLARLRESLVLGEARLLEAA